jgi:iron(III) transport system permease protein
VPVSDQTLTIATTTPWASARARLAGLGAEARAAARDPVFLVVGALLTGLVIVFTVLPIGVVLGRSLQTKEGAFTWNNFLEFFSRRAYYRALINSLILSTSSTLLVTATGFVLAYLVTRGPRTLRGPFTFVSLLPFVAPPFAFSVALIILAGRRGILTQFLGLNVSIYGWPGVLVVQLVSFLPIAFLLIENVLVSLDPSLEDAADDLGARPGRVLFTVTIPLAWPGTLKAALLVFILAIADFGNPMIIGGGMSLLATDAYLLAVGEQNLRMASVLSVFLVIPSLFLFAIHRYLLRETRVTTITGNLASSQPRRSSPIILLPMLAAAAVVGLTILALFGVVFAGAFTEAIGPRNNFTLAHFGSRFGLQYLWTSIKMGLAAGFLAAIGGTVLAYILERKRFPGRGGIEFLTLLGLSVPGTVLGLGYLLAFHNPPVALTGTFLILVLNTGFRELPAAMEAGMSKLRQLDLAIEEASADLGVGPVGTFLKVVVPNIGSAFMAGLIYAFMTGMITVSAIAFLVSPGANLASIYILQLAEMGYLGEGCAVSVMLIAIVFACVVMLKWIAHRTGFDIIRGR